MKFQFSSKDRQGPTKVILGLKALSEVLYYSAPDSTRYSPDYWLAHIQRSLVDRNDCFQFTHVARLCGNSNKDIVIVHYGPEARDLDLAIAQLRLGFALREAQRKADALNEMQGAWSQISGKKVYPQIGFFFETAHQAKWRLTCQN